MNSVRRTPTEDCPLTKEKYNDCLDSDCCKCGFKTIIGIFMILTASITISLILQLAYQDGLSQSGIDHHGAVATDSANCSLIGTKILHKGGNAVDAAIASALCTTLLLPHKTGLGGGGYIMIYNQKHGSEPFLIDFATNTVKGDLNQAKIRIPSLLKGFEFSHRLYGILPWKDLIEPTINLANDQAKRDLAEDITKFAVLAKTLKSVALEGTIALYNGTLLTESSHSNVSSWDDLFREDVKNYSPVIKTMSSSMFYNHTVFYPDHAQLLKNVITEIDQMHIAPQNASSVDAQTQFISVLLRANKDSHYAGEDGRYTGVVAIDGGNTLVCVLSGMNNMNSQLMTAAGFPLDVVLQSDYLQFLMPVMFHKSESSCKLVGTFGTDDQMLVSQILYKLIVRSLNITQAIESSRYYVNNDKLAVENDDIHADDAALRLHLKSLYQLYPAEDTAIMKSINIVIKRYNLISSHSDSRGEGIAYRF